MWAKVKRIFSGKNNGGSAAIENLGGPLLPFWTKRGFIGTFKPYET